MSSEPELDDSNQATQSDPVDSLRGRNRLVAYLQMLFPDHGLLRVLFPNSARVGEKVLRSGHPSPGAIRRAVRRGIRTIVNLRGATNSGGYKLEKQTCEEAGVRLEIFQIKSRRLPSRDKILEARDFFDRIEYPALFHCKSGADRAGMLSALYLILHENRSVEEAMKQLSFRFLHFPQADTGVLDHLFTTYLAERDKAESEGRTLGFLEWVETEYDADIVEASFKSQGWANWLTNKLLRRE